MDTCVAFVAAVLLVALIMAPLVGLAAYIEREKCVSGWGRGGRHVEWGFFTGCFVEVEPGKWMDSEALRDVQLR